MQRKSHAHKGLPLSLQRDGVPPMMVVDGSKEQLLHCDFHYKCHEGDCHVK